MMADGGGGDGGGGSRRGWRIGSTNGDGSGGGGGGESEGDWRDDSGGGDGAGDSSARDMAARIVLTGTLVALSKAIAKRDVPAKHVKHDTRVQKKTSAQRVQRSSRDGSFSLRRRPRRRYKGGSSTSSEDSGRSSSSSSRSAKRARPRGILINGGPACVRAAAPRTSAGAHRDNHSNT